MVHLQDQVEVLVEPVVLLNQLFLVHRQEVLVHQVQQEDIFQVVEVAVTMHLMDQEELVVQEEEVMVLNQVRQLQELQILVEVLEEEQEQVVLEQMVDLVLY